MRIAQVLHGWPASQMGGTGLYVEALSRALMAMGHELAIVFPSTSQTVDSRHDDGLDLHPLLFKPAKKWRDTWDGPISPWRQWLDHWKPDVVHFHHLSGLPLTLVENTPCRTVLTLHDYAIPCARGQLITDELARCSGPSEKACTQCMSAALKSHPALVSAGRILARFPTLYRLGKRSLKSSHIDVHTDIADRLQAAHRCIQSANVLLSPSMDLAARLTAMHFREPNITELPLVHPISPFPKAEAGPVRFLFASSIIPTKGPDRLFDAFSKLKGKAELTIAGHAPDYPSHPGYADGLKEKVNRHPDARWVGHIDPTDVETLMSNHDVLVLPSRWPENSPLVIREAAAGGLSIIASADGGAGELADHAILVRDDDDLLQAMQNATNKGRTRHPPIKWPDPIQHATTLLKTAYA